MNLLRAELLRYTSRRLLRVLLLVSLLGIAIGAVVGFVNTRHPPAGSAWDMQFEDCMRGDLGPPPEGMEPEEFCSQMFGSSPDRFNLDNVQDVMLGVTFPVLLLGWTLGASFIGADWQRGVVTTTLTWEPRRVRLMLTKALVVALGGALLFLFLQVVLGLSLWPSSGPGSAPADGEWWSETIAFMARGAATVGLGSLFGFALALIGRNTAAALGAGFAYLLVVENLLRALRPQWQKWFLGDNLGVFLTSDEMGAEMVGRSPAEAGVVVAAYAAILVGAGLILFTRRDVA